jgi:hypothetical protein
VPVAKRVSNNSLPVKREDNPTKRVLTCAPIFLAHKNIQVNVSCKRGSVVTVWLHSGCHLQQETVQFAPFCVAEQILPLCRLGNVFSARQSRPLTNKVGVLDPCSMLLPWCCQSSWLSRVLHFDLHGSYTPGKHHALRKEYCHKFSIKTVSYFPESILLVEI